MLTADLSSPIPINRGHPAGGWPSGASSTDSFMVGQDLKYLGSHSHVYFVTAKRGFAWYHKGSPSTQPTSFSFCLIGSVSNLKKRGDTLKFCDTDGETSIQ